MSNLKVKRTVKDSFNLFNDGRKFGANQRNYIIKAVQSTLNSDRVKELIDLGEAYGFYGHGRREAVGRLSVKETEIVMIDGKPVVFDNVPSNRTISCVCRDDGIVEHEQEIFDNQSGALVGAGIDNGYGGWSWATSGGNNPKAAVVRDFAGFDYALQPNYLSLTHPAMMLESAGGSVEEMMLESIRSTGLDDEGARAALARLSNTSHIRDQMVELEQDQLLLEGMLIETRQQVEELGTKYYNEKEKVTAQISAQKERDQLMLEALKSMPFYLTDEQKNALVSMSTEHDKQVVQLMFESLNDGKIQTLPMSARAKEELYVKRPLEHKVDTSHAVDFRANKRRFTR
ncbi:TPA: hypothetical protein L3N15_004191 [Vibrio parahaemolyticus]|nr:hypothetical protein [Vibrio parahaemolyticus]